MVRTIASAIAAGVFLAAIFVWSTGSAQGQDKDKDMKKGKGTGVLPSGWKALALSADQKTKIYGVQKEYKDKIHVLEEQIKALKSEEHVKMVEFLTADQKKQLAKGLIDDPKTEEKKPEAKVEDKK